MRWWFEEHNEMPEPPGNPPRSGYAIFCYQTNSELKSFNNKKMQKHIGTMWRGLSDSEKIPWTEKCEQRKMQYNTDLEDYERNLKIWRSKKQKMAKREDGIPNCNCFYCTGLEI